MKTQGPKIPIVLTLLCSSLVLSGCLDAGSEDEGESGETGETGDPDPLPEWMEERSSLPHDEDPQLSEADADVLIGGQYALAMDLYHQLRAEPASLEGFSVSPISIQTAFGMLWPGIYEPSYAQVGSALHFDLGDPGTHQALNWQDAQLRALNLEGVDTEDEKADPVIVRPANGVWSAFGVEDLPQPFLDSLSVNYDAGLRLADFAADPEAERLKINAWVAAQTNDLIPELFKPPHITAEVTMVLVNALYVKAPWSAPFEEGLTQMQPFTRLDGGTASVPMMWNPEASVRWSVEEDYQAVGIPLRGGGLELAAVMPTGDFAAFENDLDGAALREAIESMESGTIELHVPRFRLKTDTSLKTAFQALGLVDVWAPNFGATFGGAILEVVHSTVLAVDETGVEAAAATGIIVGGDGAPSPEVTLTFDRPFVVVLHDTRSGTPLFVGRVLDPGA